jgi:hypothetical protein
LTGSGQSRSAHPHLLNCWNDAVLVPRPVHSVPLPPKAAAAEPSAPRNPHGETRLVPSDRTRGNRTSTPESPGWEIPEAHRARTAEQHSQLCVLRHESTPVAHATDASGTGLLEKWLYGCFVRRLYNTRRPHSALGYRPTAPAAYSPLVPPNSVSQPEAVM